MDSVPKVIYGDGTSEVAVSEQSVMISNEDGAMVVLSRSAFREIVLGWERLLDQEAE
jgi:hypothetical protein